MKLKVLFHDNCFDGAASAAIFTSFYKAKVNPSPEVAYAGLSHKAGGVPIDEKAMDGDENAIVDFRYSQSPKLTWWFDHHQSAFQLPGDAEHFAADQSGKKFHDPRRKSCTKYIADIAREKFGWEEDTLAELIHWGEIIDGAQFESPKMAVELKEPALKLMTVLEANQDKTLIPRYIEDLQQLPLSQVAEKPYLKEPFGPLWEKHQKAIEVVRSKAKLEKGVVSFDVADEGLEGVNKFISYYLYPEARYTVWVGRAGARSKISVGSNPWRPQLRTHDLSKIAERYGGGGHPVVAAISFGPNELPAARKAAAEILQELRGEASPLHSKN